jgi:hypothetical protein
MTEYGIWTENDGGFIETQLHSLQSAQDRLAEILRESEDPEIDREDLQIVPVCPDHEEQPQDGCEDCAALEDELEDGLDDEEE